MNNLFISQNVPISNAIAFTFWGPPTGECTLKYNGNTLQIGSNESGILNIKSDNSEVITITCSGLTPANGTLHLASSTSWTSVKRWNISDGYISGEIYPSEIYNVYEQTKELEYVLYTT